MWDPFDAGVLPFSVALVPSFRTPVSRTWAFGHWASIGGGWREKGVARLQVPVLVMTRHPCPAPPIPHRLPPGAVLLLRKLCFPFLLLWVAGPSICGFPWPSVPQTERKLWGTQVPRRLSLRVFAQSANSSLAPTEAAHPAALTCGQAPCACRCPMRQRMEMERTRLS